MLSTLTLSDWGRFKWWHHYAPQNGTWVHASYTLWDHDYPNSCTKPHPRCPKLQSGTRLPRGCTLGEDKDCRSATDHRRWGSKCELTMKSGEYILPEDEP